MQKLFISFTALVRALVQNEVTTDDLLTGLFYFGCSREHALSPDQDETNEISWFTKDPDVQKEIQCKVAEALLFAEEQGRAAWKKGRNDFRQLNALLAANDVTPLDLNARNEFGRIVQFGYGYSAVEALVKATGTELDVVC